ncbi:hypothetical protein A2U01_0046939, partial [Trifolium medium]|nr:hypothetical protein [Trifolium medium]
VSLFQNFSALLGFATEANGTFTEEEDLMENGLGQSESVLGRDDGGFGNENGGQEFGGGERVRWTCLSRFCTYAAGGVETAEAMEEWCVSQVYWGTKIGYKALETRLKHMWVRNGINNIVDAGHDFSSWLLSKIRKIIKELLLKVCG